MSHERWLGSLQKRDGFRQLHGFIDDELVLTVRHEDAADQESWSIRGLGVVLDSLTMLAACRLAPHILRHAELEPVPSSRGRRPTHIWQARQDWAEALLAEMLPGWAARRAMLAAA